MAATEHINLPSYEQMGRAATALETIAANMDAVSLLGNFATVEATNTASQSYKAGDYLVLNNLLCRVTSPIASGGNIVIGNNVVQTTVGEEITALKEDLMLQEETIPDTVQTITFDSEGNVSAITHTANNVAVRTDAFTFGTDTITEVRTLSTGESLTIVTNTTTLQTTVTYAAA